MLDAQFTRRAAFRRWCDVLDEVGIGIDTGAVDCDSPPQAITPSADPTLAKEEEQSGTKL
jgi:hypothetical protein